MILQRALEGRIRPGRAGFPERLLICFSVACLTGGCATESHRTLETESVRSRGIPYSGPMYTVAIGKFENSSPYMRGIFSDNIDRLGSQARTILKTHLSQSGRFLLVDRDNLDEISREANLAGREQKLIGAEIVLSGEVTEFGRRETGDRQLFGIAGRGRRQTAYAKVSINVIDVATSRVITSYQGAGEYNLGTREIIGTGSSAGYDATLNGKVLNLAVLEAVNKVVDGLEKGEWNPGQG